MKKIDCAHCGVRSHSVLRDLPKEELNDFESWAVPGLYRSRQVIFHEGTPANGLYILCHGAVKLYQSGRFGHDHILDIAGPGDVLGELPEEDGRCFAESAEAIVDSQLSFLPRGPLIDFVQRHPMAAVRLIEALSNSITSSRQRIRSLALKSAEHRLAELLMRLAKAMGEPMEDGSTRLRLPYSRRELADMIAVAPETVIRLLRDLERRQLVEARHRDLVIVDPDKLSTVASYGDPLAS